ncbi:multiheme c-type cytochrome [Candidatus Electronema sp. PJ]|uniref:globin domain-containing protein n=1 Tax=Candidatus Electronema sp. PJ TaxID=3401572 RepID=UPI003AA93B1A
MDKELASVWNVPYHRYSEEQLKKYPFYPSNIQFENNGVPFVAPSVFTCAGCHPQQYEDWQGSMHAQAFRDPIYLGELNLAVKAVGKEIARQCEGCHTAAAVVSGQIPEEFDFKKLSDLAKAGVSCDVCHSIKKHTHWETPSHEPENGSYVLSPGRKDEKTGQGIRTKYGPFPDYPGCGGGFHECVESPLHLRAELCGGCHQVFHYKEHTPLEHTYNEWKKSIYSVKGIQCQDCHMVDIETYKRSADTFQKPKRSEYRHYFNGANFTMYFLEELRAKKMGDEKLAANAKNKFDMAVARLKAAADIEITPIYDDRGELSKVKVRVSNTRCGHALPTSLTNIRQMWLEVLATDEKGKVEVKSGFIQTEGKDKGELDENTYLFNSDGMGHDMSFQVDPWAIVSFSRHDIIPPKGYRDVYYTTMGDHKTHDVTFRAKLRFRVASQKVAHKLLTNLPKGFDLNEIYGLTEVPELPVVDMVDKTVTFSTHGKPSKEAVQERAEHTPQPMSPLYEKLGGEAGVDKVVGGFYSRVLGDNRINGFFKGIEMGRQEVMMKNFLTVAFGGPRPYTGRDLRAAHAHLVKNMGLNDSHYDAVLEHMAAALRDAGVKNTLIEQVMAVANSVRHEVLNK